MEFSGVLAKINSKDAVLGSEIRIIDFEKKMVWISKTKTEYTKLETPKIDEVAQWSTLEWFLKKLDTQQPFWGYEVGFFQQILGGKLWKKNTSPKDQRFNQRFNQPK